MCRSGMMRSWVALTVAVLFLGATTLVHAASDPYVGPARNGGEVAGEDMALDGLLLKPVGVLAIVLGSATLVLTLPFSIPTRSVGAAAQKLVVEPWKYTFERPLGQIGPMRLGGY